MNPDAMRTTQELVRTYQEQQLAGTHEYVLLSRGDTDFLWSAAPAR